MKMLEHLRASDCPRHAKIYKIYHRKIHRVEFWNDDELIQTADYLALNEAKDAVDRYFENLPTEVDRAEVVKCGPVTLKPVEQFPQSDEDSTPTEETE